MGRFKIYDPEKLLKIENDSNYGKCLLCEKKLKIVMGNIKRHYEQMHSVYVDANIRNTKKCKSKKHSKFKTSINANKTNGKASGISVHKRKARASLSSPNCSNLNNKSSFTPNNNSTNDRQTRIEESDETLARTQQMHNHQKSSSSVTHELSKSDCQQSNYHSNSANARLIEEIDEIHIPCYSFINNVQINSIECCNQLEFLKCLIEAKAHVNIPLKTFKNEDTFQKALKNSKANFEFNYSPQTIGEHIDRMTKKLHQQIKKLIANRLIYLKLDIASSSEGNIMLVNIQFIKDFHFQVITLNALELSDDDLATYIKKKVISTLERFRIEISNVFSIIKDNTHNARKISKTSDKICEYPSKTEYLKHLSQGFPGHAIHFAASDIITQLNENISQSRDSAKSLQMRMLELKIKTKTTILLDNNTNWFSVYDMIESLMKLHDEIEDKSLLLVEVDWVFVKKFLESFKPIVDTASVLQTNEIVIMGDFYREWLLCEMKLEELAVRNEVALYLLKALHKRKLEFFENPLFLSALYMDPRFCYMGSMHLIDIQKEKAIVQLLQIFNKLKSMQENLTVPNTTNNMKSHLNDRYDRLERQIINNGKISIDTKSNAEESLRDVDEQRVREYLEQLQFEERLAFKTNILEYWNLAKCKNQILAEIAETALAAPATQATITRALNASSITLLKHKSYEKNENIENLLLLKLNQDLVDKISLEN